MYACASVKTCRTSLLLLSGNIGSSTVTSAQPSHRCFYPVNSIIHYVTCVYSVYKWMAQCYVCCSFCLLFFQSTLPCPYSPCRELVACWMHTVDHRNISFQTRLFVALLLMHTLLLVHLLVQPRSSEMWKACYSLQWVRLIAKFRALDHMWCRSSIKGVTIANTLMKRVVNWVWLFKPHCIVLNLVLLSGYDRLPFKLIRAVMPGICWVYVKGTVELLPMSRVLSESSHFACWSHSLCLPLAHFISVAWLVICCPYQCTNQFQNVLTCPACRHLHRLWESNVTCNLPDCSAISSLPDALAQTRTFFSRLHGSKNKTRGNCCQRNMVGSWSVGGCTGLLSPIYSFPTQKQSFVLWLIEILYSYCSEKRYVHW